MDNLYKLSPATEKYLSRLDIVQTTSKEYLENQKENVNETYIIETVPSNAKTEKKPFNDDDFVRPFPKEKFTSDYFSFGGDGVKFSPENLSLDSFSTSNVECSNILISPPFKKLKLDESTNNCITAAFFEDSTSHNVNTQSLFDSSINENEIFPANNEKVSNFLSESKMSISLKENTSFPDDKAIEASHIDFSYDMCNQQANESSFKDLEDCSEIEKSILKDEKIYVNTYYQSRYIQKTNENLIHHYYKTNKFSQPDQADFDINNLMEPSLDYLAVKLNKIENISLGNVKQEIFVNKSFDCSEISESIEEIEKSFENATIITSTPEITQKEQTFNDALENIEMEISRHVEQKSGENEMLPPPTPNINNWSEITHVSCSLPTGEQDFDLRSIFIFEDIEKPADDCEKSNASQEQDISSYYQVEENYNALLSLIQDQNLIDEDFIPRNSNTW
jgi:hypothetical protein